MSELLLIGDDIARAERLARGLAPLGRSQIHDLYGKSWPSGNSEFIIADVSKLSSEAITRLRTVLKEARRADQPLLFLAHGNQARAEAQARLLGASEIIPASAAVQLLGSRIERWRGQLSDKPVSAVVTLASEVKQFLVDAFFSGRQVSPELAAAGTDLITRAIAEGGIRDWVRAVQCYDDATHQHMLLVAGLAAAFATSLGLGDVQSYRLSKAALLHDVGKTKIPIAILNKPGPLTAEEMAIMRTHATIGHDLLIGRGFLEETLRVVRSHHEMLDGSGYPDGLKGDQIPDLVRLVTICDIYAALIERRAYKSPLPGEEAYGILKGMTGRLDGDLVRAFQPVSEAFAQPMPRAL